ncbi:MAG TPA: hypothetical protein VJV75_11705, partial [Candidatus Polarisedimenticolia bacterium]|nr:hypothetical protein [Candidatus Polarisedimenticolia bacterium]
MRSPEQPFRKRLFIRLAFVFGGTLVVSFGFVALLSIQPLRRGLDREARDDMRWGAAQFRGQVQHYLDARCDEVRLWAELAASRADAPGPATPAGRLDFLMQAATRMPRTPYKRLDLLDRAGELVATTSRDPIAAMALLPHATLVPGRCAVMLRPGGDPYFTVAATDVTGGLALVAALDWIPLQQMLRAVSIERVAQSPNAFLLLLDGEGRLLGAPEIPDLPVGPALEAARRLAG